LGIVPQTRRRVKAKYGRLVWLIGLVGLVWLIDLVD
jgi:hypothetical protein